MYAFASMSKVQSPGTREKLEERLSKIRRFDEAQIITNLLFQTLSIATNPWVK